MKEFVSGLLIVSVILAIIIAPAGSGGLLAQEEEEPDTVYIKSGRMKQSQDKIVFSEGVEIQRGQNILRAPGGEYYREEKKTILQDGVDVTYENGTVASKTMTGWLDEDKYVFEEEVVLKHTRENEETLTLQAPYLEMYTGPISFIAREGVIIDHQNQKVRAREARYEEETEILKLDGEVYIQEDEDWVKSDRAEFDLSEDEAFTAEGNVEIEIDISD